MEELRAELEVQQASLDMILLTNPGVVEQYERRKEEVCRVEPRSCFTAPIDFPSHPQIADLSNKIEDREKACLRLERDIKNARVRVCGVFRYPWRFISVLGQLAACT